MTHHKIWKEAMSMNKSDIRRVAWSDPTLRLKAEAQRVEIIRSAASIPHECGDAIPSAPGRGAFIMFAPREMVKTEAGELRSRRSGYMGRNAIRSADAFDRMQAQSARARKVRQSAGEPLFTTAQITAGREYGTLYERHDAAGAKCSSIEGSSGGGSGGGAFIDAVIRDGRRLDRMRAAVGGGWAMEPQRTSPEGGRRRAIRDLDLVHMVCVGGMTCGDVLYHFGWARGARNLAPLMVALRAALDRMYDADRR